ncbi:transferrin-binding protein-like solute binding protein [Sphingomonas solaris]|uniref:Transferrin-binding protein-like solute binding protein n=1 Tax=Alterirhizorhabdus solaris TaxID=2529389 RepID=A0A558R1L1_9SPHN|nr:transferrin-binding protein-like solute binding protein [Sphingomonas solaris]TVV73281.1 transferrin-binding protein-like solute binding protein [Sphingomonas solaris]
MRTQFMLVGLVGLSACGGTGPESAGSVAAPTGNGVTTTTNAHSFTNPTEAKTYKAIGGNQVYDYSTDARNTQQQQGQQYAGNASTARDSSITVAYDPRDAIFTLTVSDSKTGAATNTRFQDPGSRTDFGGAKEPQWGTSPALAAIPNVRFLQAGDGNPLSLYTNSGAGFIRPGNSTTPPDGEIPSAYQSTTFFYQTPGTANRAGTTTKYVTYAGYLRNSLTFQLVTVGGVSVKQDSWHLERGAFAYGEQTSNNAVPKTGSASYSGGMLATMVMNPTLDGKFGDVKPTYFQWIDGTAKIDVDFARSSVGLNVTGTVLAPQIDQYTTVGGLTPTAANAATVAAGATFNAAGTATIDLVNAGGFTGAINSAGFSATTNGAPTTVAIAGSSVNGAFYGPAAEEVGGGFRVVGGTPDQRIDILGTFTGAKP